MINVIDYDLKVLFMNKTILLLMKMIEYFDYDKETNDLLDEVPPMQWQLSWL